jgi:hypothetical protein
MSAFSLPATPPEAPSHRCCRGNQEGFENLLGLEPSKKNPGRHFKIRTPAMQVPSSAVSLVMLAPEDEKKRYYHPAQPINSGAPDLESKFFF